MSSREVSNIRLPRFTWEAWEPCPEPAFTNYHYVYLRKRVNNIGNPFRRSNDGVSDNNGSGYELVFIAGNNNVSDSLSRSSG